MQPQVALVKLLQSVPCDFCERLHVNGGCGIPIGCEDDLEQVNLVNNNDNRKQNNPYYNFRSLLEESSKFL